jgi:ADP-heptose:LPS heptosyltransferase
MNKRRKILIIRFSAMGDVAMTAPVVKQITAQNPDVDFLYLTRPLFKPFFNNIPNLEFYAFKPENYKGLKGLFKLYKELKALNITAVADLHFNMRSRIICLFFKLSGIKTVHLDKGREEKRSLTSKIDKNLRPLKPMWLRYTEVFEGLSLNAAVVNKLQDNEKEQLDENIFSISGSKENKKWIGISPFAQHLQKIYPLEKMEEVIRSLSNNDYQLFVFGGGEREKEIAEQWENRYANTVSTIGKLKMQEELKLISNLDVMISMDSSGMHLASLKGIKVVSVWGATHPFAGFLGFGQQEEHCVQTELYCRPCSVYGNKPCFRGDLACLHRLDPEEIIEKTINIINNG